MALNHLAVGSFFLMCGLEGPGVVGARKQEGGEPALDRTKGNLLKAGDDVGDAPAGVGEHKAEKTMDGSLCPVEGGFGDDKGAHMRLGDALGRIVVARENAAGGENAGLAREYTCREPPRARSHR